MATVTQTTRVTETAPALRQATPPGIASTRNVSIDAYRGLVMLLMMAEVLQLSRVSAAYPDSWFWKVLGWNQTLNISKLVMILALVARAISSVEPTSSG